MKQILQQCEGKSSLKMKTVIVYSHVTSDLYAFIFSGTQLFLKRQSGPCLSSCNEGKRKISNVQWCDTEINYVFTKNCCLLLNVILYSVFIKLTSSCMDYFNSALFEVDAHDHYWLSVFWKAMTWRIFKMYFFVAKKKKEKSYRFKTTKGRVNDDRFIFT